MRFDLRAESRRKLLYGFSVLVFACLIGIGVMAQNGWLVYGSEGSGNNSPDSAAPVKQESNSKSALPDAEAATSKDETTENETASEDEAITEEVEPPPPPPLPSGPVYFDFDGDGKTDISRWHPATAEFKIKNSNSGSFTTYTIGNSSAKAAPGKYDGDSFTDAAVFNAGTWTIRKSSDGTTQTINFGQAGDKPMAADYDGDGITDLSVIRPSTSTWWVRQSTNGAVVPHSAGNTTDIPVPGDYDGDAKADIALYRPANGLWTITYSSNGSTGTQTWGQAGTDVPVPADYDGDNKTDIAIFRRSTGTWYAIGSSNGNWIVQTWGNYGDQPVPGYYDSDNKADLSVWRPTTGLWYIFKSAGGGYDVHALGQAGDTAVPSAYLKQIGGTVSAYDLAQSRLSPKNATGGTDLYSRNFSWGTSLVGLPGRAGLDAGFGISYNALVWTKAGSEIYFDADASNVSPGFRMGFPTIEPAYYDDKTGNFAYLMVTPSGGRVEFRQVGASSVYETADSSYTQLTAPSNSNPNDPVENLTLIITGTGGTQMTYTWKGGAFRCSQIKDRNGNYITIAHNDYGQLTSMTDTLGRVVTVTYDDYGQPSAIKQAWGSGPNGSGALDYQNLHVWATFSYTNVPITTDIDGSISVIGPPNGTSIRALDKITYPDQSSTKFHYNGYGQVYKIENYSAETTPTLLNYVRTNLQTPNANQFDCPKFTETRTWAKDFNNNAEVVTLFTAFTGQTYSLPGGISGTATMIDVWTVGHPNNYQSKTYIAESGWKEGLPLVTEDWTQGAGGWAKQRWTWTNYTQDNTALTYPLNPRVIESRVGDSVNVKKTAIDYQPISQNSPIAKYGRVSEVRLYDSDLTTVLKKIQTDYEDRSEYISRRLIGLPVKTEAYGRDALGLNLMSKMTYAYDEWNFGDTTLSQNISPVQHDSGYDENFLTGRGNLTSTKRWDANNSTNEAAAVSTSVKYNTAGGVVSQTDPIGRTVKIGYADDFTTSLTFSTYAYPTELTDPANHSSSVQYRYDIGANIDAESPPPAGHTHGKRSQRTFDSLGRLSKEAILRWTGSAWVEHGYTRHEPQSNGILLNTFSTLVDVNGNGNIAEDEVSTETWFDGAGRRLKSRTSLPGSSGGWSAVKTEYDIIGRVISQSVPTEVNSGWTPAGLDTAFRWNRQEYDWKGRVTRSIPSDSTGADGKDQKFSYSGCGCSGNLVTTIEGELTDAFDAADTLQYSKRRVQKVYQDVLGRTEKVEVWDLDGLGGSPYSTTINEYNGRDQVTKVLQYAGGTSGTHQDTIMTYDGHGRLATQHLPQQDANTSTSFQYYADDKLHVKTDARGATTTMTYGDPRGLLTKIESELPGSSNTTRSNFALASNGGKISASSQLGSGYSIWYANDGDRKGNGWGTSGGWNDGTISSFPDWLEVAFDRAKTIDELDVVTLQDNYQTASDPTESTTFSSWGVTDYYVQYWDGAAWVNVPGASVTGNNKVWKKFTFTPITTTKIRLTVNGGLNGYSRVVELEAWGADAVPPVNTETNFVYDPAGNRISMTDSSGSTTYEYDSLSRMTAETRAFIDTLSQAPLPNNSFKLQYSYTVSGGLKSITDPYGDVINYDYDKAARLDSVTGSTYDGITSYATGAQYTAWGDLKALSYGNGVTMSSSFNDRLQPTHFELKKGATDIMKKNYEYYNDGRLRYVQDQLNGIFDRLNIYDHAGRIKQAKTGLEARGGAVPAADQDTDLPYRQSYKFNAFNNMIERNNLHWGVVDWYGQHNNLSYTYQNNRIANANWQYDADGRVLQTAAPDAYAASTYDARGLLITHRANDSYSNSYGDIQRFYNGDGREVKRDKISYAEDPQDTEWPYGSWFEDDPIYYIRSTVMGGAVISETHHDGKKKKTYVLAAGAKIATQSEYTYNNTTTESVSFDYLDASGMSYRSGTSDGTILNSDGAFDGSPAEFDPMGGNAGLSTPYIELIPDPPPPNENFPYFPLDGESPMMVNGRRMSCTLDGMSIGCNQLAMMSAEALAVEFSLGGQIYQLPVQNIAGHLWVATSVTFNFNPRWESVSEMWQFGGVSSWMVLSFNQQSQQDPVGTLPKGKKGGDFVNEFFDRNPNCLKRFQEIFGDKFGDFLESLRGMNFVDARFDQELLDKTAAELKIPTIENDGTFGPLSGTLRDISTYANAVTSPDTNTAYLFVGFFNKSPANQNTTKVHEQLHKFLRANHIGILRALGMEPAPERTFTFSGVPERRDLFGRVIAPAIPPLPPLVFSSELESGTKLQAWLENNCN